MKQVLISGLAATTLSVSAAHAADTYNIDPAHTNIVWSASHLGFSQSLGTFSDVSGSFTLDTKAPAKSHVEVSVGTASVVTGNPKFDMHLKSADFFNARAFPKATFKSSKVEVTGENTALVHGNLTMLGQTHPLVFKAKLNKVGENPFNKTATAGVSLTGSIDRSLYGMKYGLPAIPAKVDLVIEAEGTLANVKK